MKELEVESYVTLLKCKKISDKVQAASFEKKQIIILYKCGGKKNAHKENNQLIR